MATTSIVEWPSSRRASSTARPGSIPSRFSTTSVCSFAASSTWSFLTASLIPSLLGIVAAGSPGYLALPLLSKGGTKPDSALQHPARQRFLVPGDPVSRVDLVDSWPSLVRQVVPADQKLAGISRGLRSASSGASGV